MHGTDQSCTVSLAAAVAGWTGRGPMDRYSF